MKNSPELFGWDSNPFTFRILSNLFVGYDQEFSTVKNALKGENKFSLLLGPTGSGKTTLLKRLTDKFNDYNNGYRIIYLPKPPNDPKDWVTVFKDIIKPGFFRSIFSRGEMPDLYNLSEQLNGKLREEKCLLFIDECHEASMESLEWLRTITDQTDNLSVILAGLPIFENLMKENLETFMMRVNTRIELTNLTKSETRELIKKRIENAGGEDIKPFTHGTIDFIYEKTGGFPREILRMCNELSRKAMEKNISIIDTDFLKETEDSEPRMSLETIKELPDRQKAILETLAEKGELTPSEIVANIEIEEYKNRDNAIRSVNNLLRRLADENLVERTKKGKTYRYKVSGRYHTMFVSA